MADRFDWLLQWKDGQPEMGWSDYLAYLVPWIATKSAGSLVDAVPCIDEKASYIWVNFITTSLSRSSLQS